MVARTTGILLDQAYTGKATHHLLRLLKEDQGRFRERGFSSSTQVVLQSFYPNTYSDNSHRTILTQTTPTG